MDDRTDVVHIRPGSMGRVYFFEGPEGVKAGRLIMCKATPDAGEQ